MSDRSPSRPSRPPARTAPAEPVAIVGMSGRFPGAADPDAFWKLLVEGREGVTEAPADRPWMRELYAAEPRTPGRVPTTRGGFLDGIDLFDPAFFGMTPREAHRMDPQLRLLLECAYEAAQDGGMPLSELARHRTGSYVAAMYNDYWLRQIDAPDSLDLYTDLGASARSALSGRLAYAFDLRGPALTVDTACSSSLVSVHLACQALRAGECDLALAAGSNLLLTPYNTITFGSAGALSADGRCKFADASADGYVRSEAVGVVLLKPLGRALADGDRIRAVILGSAVNNDGSGAGGGMAAPSAEGQIQAVTAACAAAGIDPAQVAFVEAHGTGTPLGDRTELTALGEVLGPREPGQPRYLTASAKANVGHAEGAAGVVGLIKAVLQLEHRLVPGNPQLKDVTRAVDWATSPLRVPVRNTPLPGGSKPLLAGVSGFGATGTNAHLALASAPATSPVAPTEPTVRAGLLPVSARSRTALRQLVQRYYDLLQAPDSPAPGALCAAAATRRDHFGHRAAVVATSREALAAGLRDVLAGRERAGVSAPPAAPGAKPRVVFVFPGQGAQSLGMARELLAISSPFRQELERCDEVISHYAGWSLTELLHSDDIGWLERTELVQPALWALGVALAALWRSWGVEPDAVLGQSQGEIAAAHCAGALSLEESGRLSCLRAELIARLAPPGAMAWVEQPPSDVSALLATVGGQAADAVLAVAESSGSAVLSGSRAAIDAVLEGCEQLGITCQRVNVAYAAHGPQIDPVRDPFLTGLGDLVPRAADVPFLSTVTGGELPGTALDRAYWWRNLREPVRLADVVHGLTAVPDEAQAGPVVFVQMAPHPVLTGPLRRTAGAGALVLESLRRGQDDLASLYGSLARLYTAGADIDWAAVYADAGRPLVDLPRYPWQRAHYWHQAADFPWPAMGATPRDSAARGPAAQDPAVPHPAAQHPTAQRPTQTPAAVDPERPHPLLGPAQDRPESGHRSWVGPLPLDGERRYLLDHRVAGRPVMPGTGFLELALAATERLRPGTAVEVSDVRFLELLLLADTTDDPAQLRVDARPTGEGWRIGVDSSTSTDTGWTRHAEATLDSTSVSAKAATAPDPADSLDAVRSRCRAHTDAETFYRAQEALGNSWQGAFRSIQELWLGADEALAGLGPAPAEADAYVLHPAALDACLHVVAALLPADSRRGRRGFVLQGFDRVRVHRPHRGGRLWSHGRLSVEAGEDGLLRADIDVRDDRGALVAELTGVQATLLGSTDDAPARPAHAENPEGRIDRDHDDGQGREDRPVSRAYDVGSWLHTVDWEPVPAPQGGSPAGGHWLVLHGGTPLDPSIDAELAAAGCTVSSVRHGTRFSVEGPGRFRAAPGSERDLVRVLKGAAERTPLTGVVSLWGPDADTSDDAAPDEVRSVVADACALLSTLARALREHNAPSPLRLCLVTRGAQAPSPSDVPSRPCQSALWGFAQVLGREETGLDVLLADLAAEPCEGEAAQLATMLRSPCAENQLALRAGVWRAPRLHHDRAGAAAPSTVLDTTGGTSGLYLLPAGRPAPGPGQIEIEVAYSGVNYHDVLAVVGTLDDSPAHDGPLGLGFECSGTVARTGPGVSALAVGDQVMAYAHPALRSHVVTPECLAVRKPARLSLAEAAALPGAYGTAYCALVETARLRPGERVLIHSASGGVGLAALEIALARGATVYATAGSPAKRDLLLKLGAAKVADSRSTRFAEEFAAPGPDGRGGVDVILNTLVGKAVEANLSLLNPFGRYVDLARSGIPNDNTLPMAAFGLCRSYLPLALGDLVGIAPERLGELLRTVADRAERGEFAAPSYRVFPAEDAAAAFSLMARAGHTGKLILGFPRSRPKALPAPVAVRADATYLVTGGHSGVGALFAQWLADRGARHLLITGRSAAPTDNALLTRLRASGADVRYASLDVADQQALADLLRGRAADGLPPVRGVVHSAAVLEPMTARALTEDDLDVALRPKVTGGWALHRLFGGENQGSGPGNGGTTLDFFVLFSSAVSVIAGLTAGAQLAAYAAGNAFLDALAAHRRAAGLPATVVNWGYWTETGLAARLSAASGHDVRPAGMGAIRSQDAPAVFALALDPATPSPDGRVVCLPADWQTYADAYPADASHPLLRSLLTGPTQQTGTASVPPDQPANTPSPAAGSPVTGPEATVPAAVAASTLPAAARAPLPPATPGAVMSPSDSAASATSVAPDIPAEPARPHASAALAAQVVAAGASEAPAAVTSPLPQTLFPTSAPTAHSGTPSGSAVPALPQVPASSVPQDAASPASPAALSALTDPDPHTPALRVPAQATASQTAPEAAPAASFDDNAARLRSLAAELAVVMGLTPDDIDPDQPMNRIGMDSLMAAELRVRLRTEHQWDVPVSQLLGTASPRSIASAPVTGTRTGGARQ